MAELVAVLMRTASRQLCIKAAHGCAGANKQLDQSTTVSTTASITDVKQCKGHGCVKDPLHQSARKTMQASKAG